MTQKNPYLIESKKPVEIVQELKSEIPSFEEFMNNYESDENIANSYCLENQNQAKGYGPCGDDYNCSCKCKWKSGCSCRFKWDITGEKKSGYDMMVAQGSVKGKIGWDGLEGKFKDRKSIFREKTSYDETHCLSSTAGGSAKLDLEGEVTLKGELGFDVVNYENKNGFKTRLGANVDTGGSIVKDGIEAKFLGFGFNLGKKNGISFGVGEISKESDDCVIQ